MNHDTCQCECPKYQICKEDYSWNPSTCTCDIGQYLKNVAEYSKIVCYKITNNVNSSVWTNVLSTVSNGLIYSANTFHTDHITFHHSCYLLQLFKT